MQETVEHKKTDTVFKRMNTARNKTEKSNNYNNSFQNSKPKISEENHHASYNGKYSQ